LISYKRLRASDAEGCPKGSTESREAAEGMSKQRTRSVAADRRAAAPKL
jgi:hypothetical protein